MTFLKVTERLSMLSRDTEDTKTQNQAYRDENENT